MNTKLIWKDAIQTGNGYSEELGRAYKEFADCQYFFPPVKEDKKAVVMFKNSDNKVITVIMQGAVSDAYKAQKLSQAQALTLPIIRMEKLVKVTKDESGKVINEEVISEEPSFWLGRPNQGWQEMKKDLEEVGNWEDLAV